MLKNTFSFAVLFTILSCGNPQIEYVPPNTANSPNSPTDTLPNGLPKTDPSLLPNNVLNNPLPEIGSSNADGSMIKFRSAMSLSFNGLITKHSIMTRNLEFSRTNSQIPISITNSASTAVTFDSSHFVIPTIGNTLLDLGTITLTELTDNNLAVCGTEKKTKCTTAVIRMYTVGVAGAGVYNAEDGYGAPLNAGQTSYATVGLNLTGALNVQSVSIDKHKHILKLSDFTNPTYYIQADFSNAGAGNYSTTLIIEYALLP